VSCAGRYSRFYEAFALDTTRGQVGTTAKLMRMPRATIAMLNASYTYSSEAILRIRKVPSRAHSCAPTFPISAHFQLGCGALPGGYVSL